MHFDYTELQKPVPLKERLTYLRERPLYYQLAVGLIAFIDCIFVVVFLVYFPALIVNAASGNGNGQQLLFITTISGVVAIVMPIVLVRAVGNELRLKRFAAANNLTYYDGFMNEERNGLIFHYGDARRFTALFTPSQGYVKEFGTYCYDTGSGKNRTSHYYGFVRIKLPRKLPNIVLDSHQNNIFGDSGLPEDFSKSQVLHLEGDFDKYFTLYAPKEYEQDALYIFTPDVMQVMVNASNHYDSEIVDDDFYLYTGKLDMFNSAAIEEFLTIADHIARQLDVQAERYADERVANQQLDVVARPGMRLKQSNHWVLIVILIAFIVFVTYVVLSAPNS